MTITRRKNLLYGLLGVIVAVALLVRLIDVFPPYINDMILRAAPVILVIFGLSVLLRNRIPFSGFIALVVGILLVAGISTTAFSIRSVQYRSENIITAQETVEDDIILLRMRLQVLTTDVEIVRALDPDDNTISVQFAGSTESTIVENYLPEDDGSATYNLNELQANPVPLLEAVGRGNLLIEIPGDVPIDVQLQVSEGQATLNLSGTQLERLNIEVDSGSAIITLPTHQPAYSRPDETLGTWAVNGSTTVRVPPDVSARFDMSNSTGGNPDYDPGIYNLLFGNDLLEARNIDSADIVMRYDLIVSRDRLTIDVPE